MSTSFGALKQIDTGGVLNVGSPRQDLSTGYHRFVVA